MGNRGNVRVISSYASNRDVYLYTHWTGTDLPKIVRDALKRGTDRWKDAPYLTRIIFSEMIKDDIDGTTGFGIDTEECDSGVLVTVDVARQTVSVRGLYSTHDLDEVPFADYADPAGRHPANPRHRYV